MLTIEDLHRCLAGERISQIQRAVNVDNGFTLITGNNHVLKVMYSGDFGDVTLNEHAIEDTGLHGTETF